jgi:hypothetical protein
MRTMPILDDYLRAVRRYLPKGPQQDDIVEEIAEHLVARLEDEAASLGRPLTEVEEEAVLTRHGSPMLVAERYGVAQRGFAFGRQLISPEIFPMYARVLSFQLPFTLLMLIVIGWTNKPQLFSLRGLLTPLVIQFVLTTTIFVAIDAFSRRSVRSGEMPSGWLWNFPPQRLQPIPRWQSLSGLAVLGLAAAWWAALPFAPSLVIGGAAQYLELTPAWNPFYWPVLLVLAVGIAQRATTLRRPDWNWLQPPTRVLTNGVALVLVALFLQSYPYLAPTPGASVAAAPFDAVRLSDDIWWHSGATFGLYSLSCLIFNLILSVQFVRSRARRRLEQIA